MEKLKNNFVVTKSEFGSYRAARKKKSNKEKSEREAHYWEAAGRRSYDDSNNDYSLDDCCSSALQVTEHKFLFGCLDWTFVVKTRLYAKRYLTSFNQLDQIITI